MTTTAKKKKKPRSAPPLPDIQPRMDLPGPPVDTSPAIGMPPGVPQMPAPMPQINPELVMAAMSQHLPSAGVPMPPMAPQKPAAGPPIAPMSNPLMDSLANLAKAAALRRDMQSIQQNGLPGYHTPQEATDYGFAPGPYQVNMPAPGPPADPEAMARDRVARQGRRASSMGGWEQRILDAGHPETPPELQRSPNLSLTPQQFLQQLAEAKAAAQQQFAGTPDAGGNRETAAYNPTEAAGNTYRRVADQRGVLPTGADVASNLANREQELLQRQKAVENRGLVRGKSKELGIPRAVAGAMMGLSGQAGSQAAATPQIFAHYYAMTGDAKTAAQLTEMHANQNKDPLQEQMLAGAAAAADPEQAKWFRRMYEAKYGPQGAASAAPTLPGADPAVTKSEMDKAIRDFPNHPGKAAKQLAQNAGISDAQAEELIKANHKLGPRWNQAAADAMARQRNGAVFGNNPLLTPIAGLMNQYFGSPEDQNLANGILPQVNMGQ